ncbi:MAG: hypothetical protein R3B84_11220 [Zavarzinella sp.]
MAAQGPLWSSGGDRGLYKTTDGGKSWSAILTIDENTGITDFLLDPENPNQIVAASYQRRRHVWTLVNGGPGSAIHRTTDGGKTWKKIRSGLPNSELGRIGLAQAASQPQTIYAVVEAASKQGGIFRSDDFGVTWQKRNPYDQQAQYYAHLVVDPTAPDKIFVMGVYIQVSIDGGKTLTSMPDRNKHVDNHAMWINPANTNHYLVGCDGGIYESFDQGANWNFKPNLPITQFYDIGVDQNPKSGEYYHVYGGTQDNFTLGAPVRTRSSNGINNNDWYVVQGGDGFHCAVDPEDPNIVYAEYQYGGLCRFDRSTGNRVDISPLPPEDGPPLRWNWDAPLIISPHAPKRLYYAANRLFRSDDRGDSWVLVSPDLTRQLDRNQLPVMGKIQPPDAVAKNLSTSIYGNIVALAESPKVEGLIAVGTDDGLIQFTEDGGKTWRKIEKIAGVPEKTYVSKIVASRHDESFYVAFDNHKNGDFAPYLYRTSDRGKTWQAITSDLPTRGTVYAIAEDHVKQDLLFCGTEFALYVSVNGGKNWHSVGGLPTIQVKDLVIQRANDDLVIGTFGRGIYVIDHYTTFREAVSVKYQEKNSHIFPPRPVVQYVPSQPLGGSGNGFVGESHFSTSPASTGATITYYVKESLKTLKDQRKASEEKAKDSKYPSIEQLRKEEQEEKPSRFLKITDSEGKLVQLLPAASTKGLHTARWDLRDLPSYLTGTNPGRGFSVLPGKYRVALFERVNGKTAPLGDSVELTVLPDPLSPITPAQTEKIQQFRAAGKKLMQQSATTEELLSDVSKKLGILKAAATLVDMPDDALLKTIVDIQLEVQQLTNDLRGDDFLAERYESVPTSINDRLRKALYANSRSITPPGGTQLENLKLAETGLKRISSRLSNIQEVELPKIHARLKELNAPSLPGVGK